MVTWEKAGQKQINFTVASGEANQNVQNRRGLLFLRIGIVAVILYLAFKHRSKA